MDIKNKVAVVTGGIGGIGFVTTQYLLKNEVKYVGILDVLEPSDAKVQKNLRLLEEQFVTARFGYYTCDVTNAEQFRECYKKVLDAKQYIDVLINNAGVLADTAIDKNIDVNYKAVVKGTLLAIEHMGKHNGGKGGVVVNLGSIAGLNNFPSSPVYNGSKHAVVSFVRSMKGHSDTTGTRVVCICPGFTESNLFDHWQTTVLPFVDSDLIPNILGSVYIQKPNSVASSIVKIIEKGKDGDVWLVEQDEPPRGVRDVDERSHLTYDLELE